MNKVNNEDQYSPARIADLFDSPNTGDVVLRFLCCCAPAYEHEDTVMVEDWP